MGLGICRRAGRTNESAPKAGAVSKFNRPVPQAATLTSRSLLELAIGIAALWPARTVFKNESEPLQEAKPNISQISLCFHITITGQLCQNINVK
jgi:hypothetical protein